MADTDLDAATFGVAVNSCIKKLKEQLSRHGVVIDVSGQPPSDRFQQCMDQIEEHIKNIKNDEDDCILRKAETVYDLPPSLVWSAMGTVVESLRDGLEEKVVIDARDFLRMTLGVLSYATVNRKKVTVNSYAFLVRYIDDYTASDENFAWFGNGNKIDTAKVVIHPA